MTDRIKERLQNKGVEFTRRTAEAAAKEVGLRLSDDFFSRKPYENRRAAEEVAPEPTPRAAGD